MDRNGDAYLWLLERALTGMLTDDPPCDPWTRGLYSTKTRAVGGDWPSRAHTMIGLARLRSLRACCQTVLAEDIPGDFMECGIWRGGACIMMRAILQAAGDDDRSVWCADSFAGVPPPSDGWPQDDGSPHHTFSQLAVPLVEVTQNFMRYNLLDERVKFLPGLFRDTLAAAPVELLSVLRVDCDLYESTTQCLEALYPKVADGGYVVIDDCALEPARRAVDDFRRARGIGDQLVPIDWTGVFWRKGSPSLTQTPRTPSPAASP